MGDKNLQGSIKLYSKIIILLNNFLAKYIYNAVIVKSKYMQDKLLPNTNSYIIPNGVDLSKFYLVDRKYACKNINISPFKKNVLFVGDKMRNVKNYKLAQEAINLNKSYEINFFNVWNVHNDEINLYLNSADCLLLTSYHEGSPNVIKEAMACCTPIVSTDVGDVREVIGNTEGCYICSYDPVDVVEKITMALEFGNRTKGREKIKHLEINTIAEKIIQIYRQLWKPCDGLNQ